ncbi:MAG TPA: VanW family protein, partial [Candidatus Limnocylindria bacterium]|nr:VanW family protein [Candidatus Limnocylindria bacterium]
MTTIPTALTRPRLLFAPGPMRRGFLLGFFATLLVGLMMVVGASIGVALSHADRVMPGVSVAGVQIGGLDRTQAIGKLQAELPAISEGALALDVDGTVVDMPYSELGIGYDLEASVDAAMGVARSGNFLADGVARLRTIVGPSALAKAAVVRDQAAIDALVNDIAVQFDRDAQDGTVNRHSEVGYQATRAIIGLTVDQNALTQALADLLAVPGASGAALDVTVQLTEPEISSREAIAAALAANWVTDAPLALTGVRKELSLNEAALNGVIRFGTLDDGSWGMKVSRDAVRNLLRPVAASVAVAPRDATFIYGSGGIVGVIAAEPGRTLQLKATVTNVMAALELRAGGSMKPAAALAIGVAKPEVTTAEAKRIAPVMRPLASWTTYYVASEGNFWNANIHIPAWDLDGKVIAPGEWFEFWQGIGPVTLERGYGYGGAIIGGRSVPNGALAGGICSTSTTLFNAAMRAGLQIGERTNHSYYIERYPMGLDATVLQTDTWETDMTFRNDMEHPIVIRSYTGNGWVRFDIWGVPDGRTVSLSAPITSNHGTAIETTVVNPDLAPGTSKRVEYMHNGFDAVVTRWVRDADGNLIHENTWYSHYRTVNGIT